MVINSHLVLELRRITSTSTSWKFRLKRDSTENTILAIDQPIRYPSGTADSFGSVLYTDFGNWNYTHPNYIDELESSACALRANTMCIPLFPTYIYVYILTKSEFISSCSRPAVGWNIVQRRQPFWMSKNHF